jgi:phosphatidylethanolamine-binding protein (PEBP) family uncharacterized protein
MARFYPRSLVFAVAVSAAWALGPPVVPIEEYACDGMISLNFQGTQVQCGTEIPLFETSSQPTISYQSATPGLLYTVIIVDRDAISMSSPIYSPIMHFVVSNVTGEELAAGLNTTDGLNPFLAYARPMPPVAAGCHRYYIHLYLQSSTVSPNLKSIQPSDVADRIMWDFPQWAASQSLTKLAVNFFTTQNPTNSTGPCSLPGQACPAPPKELCCTRLLSRASTAVSIRLPFRAALSSITLWVDHPTAADGGPPNDAAAATIADIDIRVGTPDAMAACPLAGAPPQPAEDGFATAPLACRAYGVAVGVAVPAALRPAGPAAPPVAVKVCVADARASPDAGPPPAAVLRFRL